ncbi:MAG: acyloxyacyl hydrolase [Alphaproteobacteria bacterium]
MNTRNLITAVILSALAYVGSAVTASADDEPAFIRFGAGYYDINDNEDAGEFHFEYISDSKWWVFTPMVGVMATTDSAAYAYAGIRLDLFLGRRWVLTPQFAPGLYEDGDGKDLGHVVEFRSALELAYRFDDRSRLGVSIYHLSNASLDDNNPGTEVLTLHYSLPVQRLFGNSN